MGILKHLLFWPVTGPMFLTEFSLGQVEGVVREQLTDDTQVKAELLELQLQLEVGDIDDAQFAVREAALMQRLREVREWRERYGMGVSGGLVRVAGGVEASSEVHASVVGEERAAEPEADVPPIPTQPREQEGPRVADPGSASIEINLDWD